MLFLWQGRYHISWHLAPIWIYVSVLRSRPTEGGMSLQIIWDQPLHACKSNIWMSMRLQLRDSMRLLLSCVCYPPGLLVISQQKLIWVNFVKRSAVSDGLWLVLIQIFFFFKVRWWVSYLSGTKCSIVWLYIIMLYASHWGMCDRSFAQ